MCATRTMVSNASTGSLLIPIIPATCGRLTLYFMDMIVFLLLDGKICLPLILRLRRALSWEWSSVGLHHRRVSLCCLEGRQDAWSKGVADHGYGRIGERGACFAIHLFPVAHQPLIAGLIKREKPGGEEIVRQIGADHSHLLPALDQLHNQGTELLQQASQRF